MKNTTQKINRKDLAKIYDQVCEGWQKKITSLVLFQSGEKIEVDNSLVNQAFNEANADQKKLLEKYFDVKSSNIIDRIKSWSDVVDAKLLCLLDKIIDSNSNGLPLGSFSSQWLANFYLSKFDHWIKESEKVKYFRYCDDIVCLSDSKSFLHLLRNKIQKFLSKLKLTLSKYQVTPISLGIDFVGYKHFLTHTLLRKSIKQNFIHMIKCNFNQKSIASYYGWLVNCNGKNLFNKYVIQC